MKNKFMHLKINNEPVLATAIHAGHAIRKDLKPYIKINEKVINPCN